jgi:hypothetical protein
MLRLGGNSSSTLKFAVKIDNCPSVRRAPCARPGAASSRSASVTLTQIGEGLS